MTFSGDLGRDQHPLLRVPPGPPPADTVVAGVDATATGAHPEEAVEVLGRGRAPHRGARRAPMPAFAVDRMPMLLHVIAGAAC